MYDANTTMYFLLHNLLFKLFVSFLKLAQLYIIFKCSTKITPTTTRVSACVGMECLEFASGSHCGFVQVPVQR